MSEVIAKPVSAVKATKERLPIERGNRYALVDAVKGCQGMYRITTSFKAANGSCFDHFSESKWIELLKFGAIKATPRILKGELEMLATSAEYFKVEEQADILEPEICILTLPSSTVVLEYTWKGKKWQYEGHKFLDQYSTDTDSAK